MLDSLIVEANIIFAALIKKSGNFKLISLLPKLGVKLYSPEFVFEEIGKREEKLLKFSGLNISELRFLTGKLFKSIKSVSKSEYGSFLAEAKDIFPEHPKDSAYFALALRLNIPLWSNEKLHENQPKVKVYSTSKLLKELKLEK